MAKSKTAIFLLIGSLAYAVPPKKKGDRPEKISFKVGDRLDEDVDAETLEELVLAKQAGPKDGAVAVSAVDDKAVKKLQAEIDTLTGEKTTLEGEVETLKTQVTDLTDERDKALVLGGKAGEQIADLEKQVKTLTADLDAKTQPAA
jgi:chromosome segregation ATPase